MRDVLGSLVDEKHHGDGLNVPRSCYVGGAEGQGNYVRPFEEGCPPLADTSLASASVDAAFADKYAERFGFSVPVATLMATEGFTAELVAFALLKDFDDKVASGSCTAALHLFLPLLLSFPTARISVGAHAHSQRQLPSATAVSPHSFPLVVLNWFTTDLGSGQNSP